MVDDCVLAPATITALCGTQARLVLMSLCVLLLLTSLAGCRARGDERRALTPAGVAPILLFDGTGTSAGDVAALEDILKSEHLNYSAINSQQLNRMSGSQLQEYRLLIVPGGNFVSLGKSLTTDATAQIRSAIQHGLNYLGICAGAFFASNSPYNGLNLTSGLQFHFYSAESQGVRKTAVAITTAGGETLDQDWEDGPELTGWGTVVGKYPDGTPAIVQGTFGAGAVTLTGVHPEAPESWRRGMEFRMPASLDRAYAATLIRAALNREWLPHY